MNSLFTLALAGFIRTMQRAGCDNVRERKKPVRAAHALSKTERGEERRCFQEYVSAFEGATFGAAH